MLEKLKQCPFCGGDVKIINAEELTINHHRSGGERVMKFRIANLMLKFISKLCTRNTGLVLQKYSKLSGEIIYKLEWRVSDDKL